jgi:hypothetical protein
MKMHIDDMQFNYWILCYKLPLSWLKLTQSNFKFERWKWYIKWTFEDEINYGGWMVLWMHVKFMNLHG